MNENELDYIDIESDVEVLDPVVTDFQPLVLQLDQLNAQVSKIYTCLWLTSGFICYYIIRKIARSISLKVLGGGRRV